MRVAARAYGLLLLLYPPAFRRRNGSEMERFFRERAEDALARGGGAGLVAHSASAAWDVAATAAAEWSERFTRGGGGGMDGFWRDVRQAARAQARAPGFALVAVVTIGLGIGANTAIFSVVRGVLLRPLPYPEPHELVLLWGELRNRGVMDFPTSPPDLLDLREGTPSFEGIAAIFTFQQALTGGGEPQQITVGAVTADFFDVLGVQPARGRAFDPADADPVDPAVQPGDPAFANNVGILSHALWQQRFGSDPGVVGRIVEVGGTPTEIVGVMPADFRLVMPPGSRVGEDPDLWWAARIDFAAAPRNNVFLMPVARLADGATLDRARAEIDRVTADIRATYETARGSDFHVRAVPLHEDVTSGVRPFLVALMGAVGFVLLVACANIANLLLVRASTREREIAIRAALGGSRRRIVRQLLAESVLLAGLGGLLGVGLAWLGVRVLLELRPEELPRLDAVALDGATLGFTALAAVAAAVIFGLAPALGASRVDPAASLRDRGGGGGGASARRLRNGVVVAEVALTVVLLVGAGLMVRSSVALSRIDPGLDPDDVLIFDVPVAFARYPTTAERTALMERLREAFEAVPGVGSATVSFALPLQAPPLNGRWGLEDALSDPEAFRQADYRPVLPGYFETLDTELLEGRVLTRADNADSAAVVVVDRRMAETAFPGGSAVGRRILVRVVSAEAEWVEIVGVVENQRGVSLTAEGRETVFFPERFTGSFGSNWAVEVGGDPLAVVPAIRRAASSVDPDLPVHEVRLMTDLVREAGARTRFALLLLGVFAGIAVVLSAVGLYGVLSWAVRQRTPEIGVRMAFGAERGAILGMVAGHGLLMVTAGLVGGLAGALLLTRLMESLLVGVAPTDPATFAAVGLFFLLVAAVACSVPALRATRVDPVRALQEE